MPIRIDFLLKGTAWTVGAYGVSLIIRLFTNVILARLLAPELFGIFLIVNSLRTGLVLLSDFGIGQNIVYNANANQKEFYNTAWTLEIIRNFILFLICVAAAGPIANFFQYPILAYVLPIASTNLIIVGFSSPGLYLLQKGLRVAQLSMFETIVSFLGSLVLIGIAYVTPTIWALVIGGLFISAISTIGSFFLLSGMHHRFHVSKRFAVEILQFGKWIFLSSIVYFLSMNYDRLYLAKLLPLGVLGIYGIARTISELVSTVITRLGSSVLFPFIASHAQTSRPELRDGLAGIRLKFLVVATFGFSLFITTADLGIRVLYDERYQAAAWMLPVLITGAWFSLLASLNEACLLGLGRPSYAAISNGAKFGFLFLALPLGFFLFGTFGVVLIVASSEFFRYIPTGIGQIREQFSFVWQDLLSTAAMLICVVLLEWLRWTAGFGTSLDSFPM